MKELCKTKSRAQMEGLCDKQGPALFYTNKLNTFPMPSLQTHRFRSLDNFAGIQKPHKLELFLLIIATMRKLLKNCSALIGKVSTSVNPLMWDNDDTIT